jgi:hypothetical protein
MGDSDGAETPAPDLFTPIRRAIPDHREAAEAAVAASFRVMALTVFALSPGNMA